MKKITSAVLIALMTLTIVGSSVSQPDHSTLLTNTEMVMIQGGGISWACIGAMGGMVVATAGMVAGAASIVGFGIAFLALCFTTYGMVDACGR